MMNAISWLAATTAVIGALLIAMNTDVSRFGWVGSLISSFAWIIYALFTHTHAMLFMQLVFAGISLVGLYRWRKSRPQQLPMATWRDASVLTNRPLRGGGTDAISMLR